MARTAWAHGLNTTSDDGAVLDAWYPAPALGEPPTDRGAPAELLAVGRLAA